MSTGRIGTLALATRVAQKIAGPAEAILGYQTLILEELRQSGPAEAREDLEKVLGAARALQQLVHAILRGEVDLGGGEETEARLRHDLRTPINAILGYSEMVLEDFAADLGDTACADINTVLSEARRLLAQIETLVDMSRADPGAEIGEDSDTRLAEDLERTLRKSASSEARETGRILIVDDEPANREILARQLRRKGHVVRTAGSARDAFETLAEERFDLALVDILMPDMNGIELLGLLKGDVTWRDMPVVMISGLNETAAIVKCIAAGAEDYLPKPVDPVLLHARVEACLERFRLREREKEFTARIQHEKDRADALLHAVLPAPVIRRLNDGEAQIADRFDDVSIIFADIVDFTPLVARTDPSMLLQQLAVLFSEFDDLAEKHGIDKIKTIGDAYMAAAGVPDPRPDHARAAIAFSRDLIRSMARGLGLDPDLKVRVGVHSGPVVAGLIGRKRFVYDVWGETVNLASRLETTGMAGRIQISGQTLRALGEDAGPAHARDHEVKGIGLITTYLID
jgi:adenylate cyclase